MGATSLVKRSAIRSGAIAFGEKVTVAWGKTKKTYNAEVVDDGSRVQVPPQPASNEEEPLAMELVDPAPAEDSPHEERQPALIDRMERLTDLITGLEARVLCRFDGLQVRFDGLEGRLTQLQLDVERLKNCHVGAEDQHAEQLEDLPENLPAIVQPSHQEMETPAHTLWTPWPRFESPALADVSNRSANGVTTSASGHESVISQELLTNCLRACKSRRNLAGRLAAKLFTLQEKTESNCRGACGKKALNTLKLKAIHSCCIANYPLERLETSHAAEKEMRNAIDEVCRKTKAHGGQSQRENVFPL